jgi:hypothetical protein
MLGLMVVMSIWRPHWQTRGTQAPCSLTGMAATSHTYSTTSGGVQDFGFAA